jgi:hypothetical protein
MTTRLVVSFALAALTWSFATLPAVAQRVTDTLIGSCVVSGGARHCAAQFRYGDRGNNGIQSLREPDVRDLAEVRNREERWASRCKPQLRYDRYGVSRYVYAARGCEYGVDRD